MHFVIKMQNGIQRVKAMTLIFAIETHSINRLITFKRVFNRI